MPNYCQGTADFKLHLLQGESKLTTMCQENMKLLTKKNMLRIVMQARYEQKKRKEAATHSPWRMTV